MYMKLHIPDNRNRDWTCALFIIKKIFSFSKRKKKFSLPEVRSIKILRLPLTEYGAKTEVVFIWYT